MRTYPIVTDQHLIKMSKLAKQLRNQRAKKIKNKFLKQTHDIKLEENSSPVTKRLDEVKESTQKLGDIIKESNSENETPQ